MKKIEIDVKNISTGVVKTEAYTIPFEDPQQWAEETVASFNRTLRPWESARELVEVRTIEDTPTEVPHDWAKRNLVTIISSTLPPHDVYICNGCGITGKRFGLDSTIQRDYRYRGKKHEYCTSKETKS